MSGAPVDIARLRAHEFPWSDRGDVVYLNHASTGPLPQRSVRVVAEFTALRSEPHLITEEMEFGTLVACRERLAAMLRASPDEIAMMVNTSYGINLAARSLRLQPDDVVLTFDREFPANVYPWMALERDGVRLDRIPGAGDLPDEAALLAALDRPRVRVVSISWVQFATGYRADLQRIGRACRERGIIFVVDAIQGLGAASLDLRDTPVDILACGGQKWLLSPWGTGFVYVRRGLVERLEPTAVSWMAFDASDDFSRLVDYDFEFRRTARRFEMITLPYQEFAGMSASLELLGEAGDAVERGITAHCDRLVDWAGCRKDCRLVTPPDRAQRAGIIAIAPRDPDAVSARLTAAGVVHALREGAIRLSPHFYNTPEEIDRALELLGG